MALPANITEPPEPYNWGLVELPAAIEETAGNPMRAKLNADGTIRTKGTLKVVPLNTVLQGEVLFTLPAALQIGNLIKRVVIGTSKGVAIVQISMINGVAVLLTGVALGEGAEAWIETSWSVI